MSTEFINDQWRLPNNENKAKQSNYSMDFSGTGDKIQTTLTPPLADNSRSISLWFYTSNSSSHNMCGYGAASQVSGHNGFDILTYTGNYVGIHLFGTAIIAGGTYNLNAWNHYVITYDGTTLQGYLNGVAVDSNSTEVVNTLSTNNFIIGEGVYTGFNGFSGKLDGISIFDYALSSSQITTLYGSSSTGIGNPMTLNPVAYYPLGDQDAFNGSNYLVPNSSLKDYVFDFDGSNDYIDYGNVDALKLGAGDFTWSGWINPDSWGSSFEALYTCLASNGVWIGIDGTNFVLRIVNGSNIIAYSTLPTVNTWTNICITRVSGACTLYYNGVSVATATSTHNFIVNGNVNLGGYGTYGNFNGKISNVQVFNTGLSATGSNSVETLYNNGSPLTSMTGFTSLVSWWKLDASDTYDSSTGNWTIEDHAGSNDGTSSGMTQSALQQSNLSFKTSYSPYALDFDGVNDYIDCGNVTSLNNLSAFSTSTWINYEGTISGASSHMFLSGGSASNNRFYVQLYSSNQIRYGYNGSTIVTTSSMSSGSWYNIVTVHNGTSLDVYLNGVKQNTSTVTVVAPSTNIGNSFQIGKYFALSSYYFNGSISNPSTWNTSLTSSQVSEIYSEGIPQNLLNHSAVSSLVSWWQLGSNSSFNSSLNQWTCIDEKGTNTGESSQTFNEDAIVDGVGSYANGVSSGMSDAIVGDAFGSSANSLSYNMDVLDRTEDTPS